MTAKIKETSAFFLKTNCRLRKPRTWNLTPSAAVVSGNTLAVDRRQQPTFPMVPALDVYGGRDLRLMHT